MGEEDRLIIAEDDVIKKESPDSFKTDYHGSSDGGGKPLKKQRRKQNRFNGLSEEELAKRLLPDLLLPNLDILIVSLLFYQITLVASGIRTHASHFVTLGQCFSTFFIQDTLPWPFGGTLG